MFGTTEILLIAGVGLFFFGRNKMKEYIKDLMEIRRDFKK